MYSFFVTNKRGETLELTHNNNYSIIEIDGLAPGEATINTSHDLGADGDVFNSSYQNSRPITVTMAINYPAETNRLNLYRYFRPKASCSLRFKNDNRDVTIEAYVQRFNVNFFEKKQVAQIVMTCPNPYFVGEKITTIIDEVKELFEFPFEAPLELSELGVTSKDIYYQGDADTGAIFTIHATGEVSNPMIVNDTTGEAFGIEETLENGDLVVINTNDKERSVMVIKDGVETNGANKITEGSSWLRLEPGANIFSYTSGSYFVEIEYSEKFEGV